MEFIYPVPPDDGPYRTRKSPGRNLTTKGTKASIDDENLKLDSKRLDLVRELFETGHIKPFIDRSYPFGQIAGAHEYVGKGHKKGGVAITVCPDSKR